MRQVFQVRECFAERQEQVNALELAAEHHRQQLGSGFRLAAALLHQRKLLLVLRGQIVDTLLFITISFLGERPIMDLMVGQMIAKVILSIILVPPLIALAVSLGRKLDR